MDGPLFTQTGDFRARPRRPPSPSVVSEFVQAVCTFCCLSAADMLKFCFMVYDKDRSGLMEMEELHHFIKASAHLSEKEGIHLGTWADKQKPGPLS